MTAVAAPEVEGTLTPPGTGTFTTIHFVLIALLAAAALLILIVGIRKARARRAAERRVQEEAAEAGVPPPPPAPAPTELRDAPIPPQSLDRSTIGIAPTPPANDDLVAPQPVGPAPTEPVADEAPPARPMQDERIAVGFPQSSTLRGALTAAPMDASPAAEAEPAPAQAGTPSPADGPVTQLKGLGPKVAARLAELGITTVGQIAALDADQAQALDGRLGPFAGRLHRDRWIEQARFLAAGDRAGFEAVFGKL
ncbi:hypothetical protein CKY28_14200 [Sphingomonas lenta]|uniref:Uncharacterized protein n=1 Tax=Sphingomonas lenta TaxID=1141887 RepID=A0A2A2SDU3_9SPHN|nr:hypothetical protein CKY28_14200 [Sphingomonas lenta]